LLSVGGFELYRLIMATTIVGKSLAGLAGGHAGKIASGQYVAPFGITACR
jgi:hypothetical protein